MRITNCKKTKHINELFKLIFKNWIRLKFPPLYTVVFTPIFIYFFMLISVSVNNFMGNDSTILVRNNFMSGILIASLPIAINIMPATIVSFRNSTLSEKIGISTISKYNYILTNIIFYFMILFLTSTWDFIWVIIFNSNHLTIVFGSYQETSVNWGGFLLALVISYLTYLIIGISIALIFKTNVTTQIVGSLFYILSLIFSGQIIPFFILDSQRALKIVSYISPFRYVTGLLQMSWNNYHDINGVVNGGLFNPFHDYWISINNKTSIVSLHTYDIWLCWFMPPFFMIGFIGLTSKCFKWRI